MKLNKPSASQANTTKEAAPKPFSLSQLARRKAAEGSAIARTLMRAAERAVTTSADVFRSAAYLTVAPDSPVPTLKDGRSQSQSGLQIDLREWFSEDELQKQLPWAQPNIRLSVKPSSTRDNTSVFYLCAEKKESSARHGAVCIEIQTANGIVCSAKLTASDLSYVKSCTPADVGMEEVSYHVRLDTE